MSDTSFMTDGRALENLMRDLNSIAEIPDDVANEMLQAEGKIVSQAQKKKLRALGLLKTGRLIESIRVTKKMGKSGGTRFVRVYPYGKHHNYQRRVKITAYKRSKHGRTRTTGGGTAAATANDVAFVHEFGAPSRGIAAKNWMETANQECADRAIQAAANVYDRYLKSKGL